MLPHSPPLASHTAGPDQAETLPRLGQAAPGMLKRVGDHIGGRIRRRRTELGLTQEQLGEALGVSYQQVQKYETAANRVSAGRLYELSLICGVDMGYFFEGLEDADADLALPHGGHNRTAIDLVRNFLALRDESLRVAVSGLVKTLRERDGAPPP